MTDALEKVERALCRMIKDYEFGNPPKDCDCSVCEGKKALAALTAYRATLPDADVVEVAVDHDALRFKVMKYLDDLPSHGGLMSDKITDFIKLVVPTITPLLRAKLEQDIRREVVEECAQKAKMAFHKDLLKATVDWKTGGATLGFMVDQIVVAIRTLANK